MLSQIQLNEEFLTSLLAYQKMAFSRLFHVAVNLYVALRSALFVDVSDLIVAEIALADAGVGAVIVTCPRIPVMAHRRGRGIVVCVPTYIADVCCQSRFFACGGNHNGAVCTIKCFYMRRIMSACA